MDWDSPNQFLELPIGHPIVSNGCEREGFWKNDSSSCFQGTGA